MELATTEENLFVVSELIGVENPVNTKKKLRC